MLPISSERNRQVVAFLAGQRLSTGPRGAEFYAAFEDYYDRKLWHQLTLKLQEYIAGGDFREGTELLLLYENFILAFADKLNPQSLVLIGIDVCKQIHDPLAASEFMATLAKRVSLHPEASVLAITEGGRYRLILGNVAACKEAIEQCQKLIDAISGVDPAVHASFYRLSADVDKVTANFDGYYRNALLFLACVQLESLSPNERLERAHDLGIAALLAKSIYNFGELLGHDVFHALRNSPLEWLGALLQAFNRGDIAVFDSLRPNVEQDPILHKNLEFLLSKIRLMRLIETVFQHVGAHGRVLPFEKIAVEAHLSVLSDVEHLLMKAMSLKLIRGVIDEVSQSVHITWVQPRVLDKQQIEGLLSRVKQWRAKVAETAFTMEKTAPELFVQ